LLISRIIKKKQNNYIPYINCLRQRQSIIRNILTDEQRFDSHTFTNTATNINYILRNGLHWLYDNVWRHDYIHGDLTSNNLILIQNQLYFIDWIDTTHHFNPNNKCLITIFILADIVDYLNSFYKRFPELTKIPNFDSYFDIIKNMESDIKDIGIESNDANKECITKYHLEKKNIVFCFISK
jgi:serine/threonine-protein kinase RIO1